MRRLLVGCCSWWLLHHIYIFWLLLGRGAVFSLFFLSLSFLKIRANKVVLHLRSSEDNYLGHWHGFGLDADYKEPAIFVHQTCIVHVSLFLLCASISCSAFLMDMISMALMAWRHVIRWKVVGSHGFSSFILCVSISSPVNMVLSCEQNTNHYKVALDQEMD